MCFHIVMCDVFWGHREGNWTVDTLFPNTKTITYWPKKFQQLWGSSNKDLCSPSELPAISKL